MPRSNRGRSWGVGNEENILSPIISHLYLLSPVSPVSCLHSGNLCSRTSTPFCTACVIVSQVRIRLCKRRLLRKTVNLKSPDHHSVDLLQCHRQLLRNPQSQVSWDMLNTTANAPASSSAISAKILSSAGVLPAAGSRADVQTGV